MVHGTVTLFFRILGGLAFLLLLGAGLAAWRLSQGPVPLDPLTPYIEEALNAEIDGFRLRLGHSSLTWEGGTRSVELRVTDVDALDDTGERIAAVPQLVVTLEPAPLLRGRIRPRSVEMVEPYLTLVRDQDGNLDLGVWYPGPDGTQPAPADGPTPAMPEAGSAVVLKALVDGILAPGSGPDQGEGGPAGALSAVRVVRADATIVDHRLGYVWHVPKASVELYREDTGLGVAASLELEMREGTTQLDLVGGYRPDSGELDLEIGFAGLRPAALAGLDEGLATLAAVDLPLDGAVRIDLAVTHTLELRAATIDVTGGAGTLRLPEPLSTDYAVDALELRATARTGPDQVLIDALTVKLAEGPTIALQASGGARAAAEGGGYAAEAVVSLDSVQVDALGGLWPVSVAPNPRSWMTENLIGGRFHDGRWSFSFAGDSLETMALTGLDGSARAEGVSVHYLRPMPPVDAARALAHFSPSAVTLEVEAGALEAGGRTGTLRLRDGVVSLQELDGAQERAVINLSVDGPVPAALMLLDSKPLGYPTRLGLKPSAAEGSAAVELKMAFPLLGDLKLDDLKVQADATLKDVVLRQAVFGQDLTGGDLTVSVDTARLDAQGQGYVGGIPAGFAWRENFDAKPFQSRYRVKAVVEDDKRGVFGLDFAPFVPPYVSGPAAAELELTTLRDGRSTLGVQVDLTGAAMALPGFDWTKAAGVPAQANASVRIDGPAIQDVPRFTVRAPDLEIDGAVDIKDGEALQRAEFQRFVVGETDVTGSIHRAVDGTWVAEANGPVFDLRPFLGRSRALRPPPDEDAEEGAEPSGGLADADLPPLTFAGAFDRMITADDGGHVTDMRAHAATNGDIWQRVRLEGRAGGAAPFLFVLGREPGAPQRTFVARGDDAGALLKAFGLLGTMRGGILSAEGAVSDAGRAEGRLSIDSYRLVDAPLLAKVLSVAMLTGILDALTGEGISFTSLEAPFALENDTLTLEDFRTSGPSLGLTGHGVVNLGRDEVQVSGTLVPAYALNSLLGKIPLVGDLLTGFEKGGGLFAATYSISGTVEQPDISVNPLSAFAPGFLRNLFGLGPDRPALSEDPQPEEPQPEEPQGEEGAASDDAEAAPAATLN